MEEKIENYIDRGLESIASFLYILSIAGGILLMIIGFIMVINHQSARNHKLKVIGMICIGIGFLACFSGSLQYFA